jgi:hypothetical protein
MPRKGWQKKNAIRAALSAGIRNTKYMSIVKFQKAK